MKDLPKAAIDPSARDDAMMNAIEDYVTELMADGLSPEEAIAAAKQRFELDDQSHQSDNAGEGKSIRRSS